MTDGFDSVAARELAALLEAREPGPASFRLRLRVEGVPDIAPLGHRGDRVRGVATLLAAAAVVAILFLAVETFRWSGPVVAPGSSVAPSATPSFDPDVQGPGVVPAADFWAPWAAVAVVELVLAWLALALHNRRRFGLIGVGLLLLAYALVGTLAPVSISGSGGGPGLRVVSAAMPFGANEPIYYEVAPSGQPFTIALSLVGSSPVPVTLDGVVELAPRESFGLRWAAVWLDEAPNGGVTKPSRPFVPTDFTHAFETLWLVGRAGPCSVGPTFDPTAASNAAGYSPVDRISLRVSVLGWPRMIDVPLGATLIEPDLMNCAPANQGSPGSPSPDGSPK